MVVASLSCHWKTLGKNKFPIFLVIIDPVFTQWPQEEC